MTPQRGSIPGLGSSHRRCLSRNCCCCSKMLGSGYAELSSNLQGRVGASQSAARAFAHRRGRLQPEACPSSLRWPKRRRFCVIGTAWVERLGRAGRLSDQIFWALGAAVDLSECRRLSAEMLISAILRHLKQLFSAQPVGRSPDLSRLWLRCRQY